MSSCILCNRHIQDDVDLCGYHLSEYMFDKRISGYRLKKRNRGTRYSGNKFHATETNLIKILEKKFGKEKIVVSYRPLWAKSAKNVLYEFDVHIVGTNILIEYNGIQHYEFVPFFHKTISSFEEQQKRDEHKKQLAIDNNFEIIVFKYTEPIVKSHVSNRLRGKV